MKPKCRGLFPALFLVLMCSLLLAPSVSAQSRLRLTGSGASFPFPLYGQWFKAYGKTNSDVIIDYQAKGSGAGIRDFISHTVDFAASDAAMSDEEIAQVKEGVQLLPMTAGTIVLAYNVPGGPEELRLPREVYPKIFLGQITSWNDPLIAQANPGATLPDTDITVVRRADSSGTTFVFTQHLSSINEEWKNGPGTGKTVNWPRSDKIVAAPKNDGVTATIKQTPGAIGYVEYGIAERAGLAMAWLENKAGQFVQPHGGSGLAALLNAELPDNLRAFFPDPVGQDSYPIVTYSWLLLYKTYADPQKAAALKQFVTWCLTSGQQFNESLGYVRLPPQLATRTAAAVDRIEASVQTSG